MSLTAPIPPKLREAMSNDYFYKHCCIEDEHCTQKIEWHHGKTWQGRRIQEKAFIVPLCWYHHYNIADKQYKEKVEWIMLNRASEEQLKKYSKAVDLFRERDRLNKKYANN